MTTDQRMAEGLCRALDDIFAACVTAAAKEGVMIKPIENHMVSQPEPAEPEPFTVDDVIDRYTVEAGNVIAAHVKDDPIGFYWSMLDGNKRATELELIEADLIDLGERKGMGE